MQPATILSVDIKAPQPYKVIGQGRDDFYFECGNAFKANRLPEPRIPDLDVRRVGERQRFNSTVLSLSWLESEPGVAGLDSQSSAPTDTSIRTA